MAFKFEKEGMFSHKTSMQTATVGYVISYIIVIYILPVLGAVLDASQAVELVGLSAYLINIVLPEKIWKRANDRNG